MLSEERLTGTAAVIGAGTMGGAIAAQLANAGWCVHLLDTTKDAAVQGWERARARRPELLFLPEWEKRVVPGGMEHNGPEALREADWVVEAAFEDMVVKQSVMAQIQEHASLDALISSNTSGLSLREMTAECSPPFRARFLGTHFLNPPRYQKLLEVVPLPDTDPQVTASFLRFAEQVLGQCVVLARDTPGFISTRIGIWHLLDSLHTALALGLTVEDADAVTGPLIGRPRTGTFRLADVIGLDVLAAISQDLYSRLPHDPRRDRLLLPPVVEQMIADGHTGDKAGAGFYKREGMQTLALDLRSGKYRPRQDTQSAGRDGLISLPLAERLPVLRERPDIPAVFVDTILTSLTQYVTQVAPEIADAPTDIDRVMQWGFGWEQGPFALAKARVGVSSARAPKTPDVWMTVADWKTPARTVQDAPEASLIDIGDGVACLEFHTKMNTFSPALSAFVDQARERAEREFAALVIANDARHFSAGYNLSLFLEAATLQDWPAIDTMLRDVQFAFLGLKYARVPVVAAPRGYTLGAGCELTLHCAAVVAAPEIVIGLPELNVGVLPAGGGTTQMLIRAVQRQDGDLFPAVARAWERLAFPRNSANAYDAQKSGFLRPIDCIVRNPDRLLFEARRHALSLAEGYVPPERQVIPVGGSDMLARLRMLAHNEWRGGRMTEHDHLIADKTAFVLAGGSVSGPQIVSEEYLFALERQVFLELMRMPETAARMHHVLDTGKPLKN